MARAVTEEALRSKSLEFFCSLLLFPFTDFYQRLYFLPLIFSKHRLFLKMFFSQILSGKVTLGQPELILSRLADV